MEVFGAGCSAQRACAASAGTWLARPRVGLHGTRYPHAAIASRRYRSRTRGREDWWGGTSAVRSPQASSSLPQGNKKHLPEGSLAAAFRPSPPFPTTLSWGLAPHIRLSRTQPFFHRYYAIRRPDQGTRIRPGLFGSTGLVRLRAWLLFPFVHYNSQGQRMTLCALAILCASLVRTCI